MKKSAVAGAADALPIKIALSAQNKRAELTAHTRRDAGQASIDVEIAVQSYPKLTFSAPV